MRTITAIAALTGTLMIPVVGFFNIPAAQADSLSAKEVVKGIVEDGFSAAEAVDITNAAVAKFCPSNWNLLVETGKAFREAKGGQLV